MSRNFAYRLNAGGAKVTPREGRVSRNQKALDKAVESSAVTPREGRVSRNLCKARIIAGTLRSRPARGV